MSRFQSAFPWVLVPAIALALGHAGCEGGADDGGGRDAPAQDGVADTDIPIPEGAIPIVTGSLGAADASWVAAGAAWSRAASAATQMVSAVNGFVLCSVDNYGLSPRTERMDAARKSLEILADAGEGLVDAAAALPAAVPDTVAQAVSALSGDALALASRRAEVAEGLRDLGTACVVEAARVAAILDGVDAATATNAGLDAVVQELAGGANLWVAAGPVLASAGTVNRTVAAGTAHGALAAESAGQAAARAGGDVVVLSGWAGPDGAAGPVPVLGDAPGTLVWRGDALAAGPGERAVSAVVAKPDELDGLLATMAFVHPAAAVVETRPLAPGEACWLGADPREPACTLAGSGLLPAGWYVDRDGDGAFVEAPGISQAVGRRIATGLDFYDVVVAVPEDTESPVPIVTALSPAEGPIGTTVTLSGEHFGSDPSRVRVRFECGQWADVQPNAVTDTTVSATLPARPTLDVSGPWCTYFPEGFVNCGVNLQVGARRAWGSYFKLTGLPLCPPSLLYPPSPAIASVGDPINVYGRGFSENLSANVARFAGGKTATATKFERDIYEPDMARVYFTIPEGAVTGDVQFRNTEGVDAWSAGEPLTIVPPTVPIVGPGPEGAVVHVPIVTFDLIGSASPSVWGFPYSWILSHQQAGNMRSAAYEKTGGHVTLAIETRAGNYTTDAYALDDTRLLVPVPTDAAGTLGRLAAGESFTVRVIGVEMVNNFERVGPPLDLVVASRPEVGASHRLASSLTGTEWGSPPLRVAVGDAIYLAGAEPADVVSTGGLTAGDVVFQDLSEAFATWKGHAWARGVRIPVDRAGTWTLTNTRTGQALDVVASTEGTPASASWPPIGGGLPDVAAEGASLACGGARVDIPPGALPPSDEGYMIWCARQPLEVLGLPELTAGGMKSNVYFSPEPPALLKPIALSIPVDAAARASDPELGLMEESSGLYATLPATRVGDTLRLVLPAGTYAAPAEASRSGAPAWRPITDLPWPLPDLPLNKMLGALAAVSYRHAKGVLRDDVRQIQVNYVATPGATSYVTDDYAGEVLVAAQAAWDTLTGKGWPKPDGWLGGWISLTITDMGPATGTKGSTTKGVFGQPWVKINSRLASGKQLATTTAHEMGHVFQRQVTTVFSLKWIDEAAAGWAAYASLGTDADLSDDIIAGAEFPALTLPTSFGSGYDVEQGYAAAALAIWMEEVSAGSVLRVYEQLRDSYATYLDAWGTLSAATGRNPSQIVDEFATAYWSQSLDVLAPLSISQTSRNWTDWTGVTVGDTRPKLSGKRFDISTASAQTPALAGRDLVVRTAGLSAGQAATIYRDTVNCGTPQPAMQKMMTIFQDRPNELLGAHDAGTRCYRVLVTNFSQTDDANVQVRIVAPQVTGLSPKTGKNDGGYTVSVGGTGFGASQGAGGVFLAGFPLDVTSWSDTSINATMIDAGTMQGDLDLKVLTAEQAWTNAATFTLYD